MHCMNHFKIFDVQRPEIIDSYKNDKLNVLRPSAAIWFKKICRTEHLSPSSTHLTKIRYQPPTATQVLSQIWNQIRLMFGYKVTNRKNKHSFIISVYFTSGFRIIFYCNKILTAFFITAA